MYSLKKIELNAASDCGGVYEVGPIDGDSGRKSGLEKTGCAVSDSSTITFVRPLEKQNLGMDW